MNVKHSSNKLRDLIKNGEKLLLDSKLHNAKQEIQWFLEYQFSFSNIFVKLNPHIKLTIKQKEKFNSFLKRRIKKEPFQYK